MMIMLLPERVRMCDHFQSTRANRRQPWLDVAVPLQWQAPVRYGHRLTFQFSHPNTAKAFCSFDSRNSRIRSEQTSRGYIKTLEKRASAWATYFQSENKS